MQFRVMTYNIHKGIGGVDRRYRPERIIETIAHCRPDIVFLQEVDDGVPRSRNHKQVDLIGDALDFHHRAFQRNVSLTRGHYGNAILSRFPLKDIRNLDLTIPLKKRRRALSAHCRVRWHGHTQTLLVFNFHLGLAAFERRAQLRRLLESTMLKRTHKTTTVIAAGDYNDVWGNLGRQLMEPASFRSVGGLLKTFPAVMPVRPLDRIYYRGNVQLDHSFVSHTEIARQASDHLPLVADFILNMAGSPAR